MTKDAPKRSRPYAIAFGFLIALGLSTATIIYTGLNVSKLRDHEQLLHRHRTGAPAEVPPASEAKPAESGAKTPPDTTPPATQSPDSAPSEQSADQVDRQVDQ